MKIMLMCDTPCLVINHFSMKYTHFLQLTITTFSSQINSTIFTVILIYYQQIPILCQHLNLHYENHANV